MVARSCLRDGNAWHGKSTFDALHAAFDSLICGWGDEEVNMLGHDDERVELVAALVAVMEQSLEQ